MEGSAALDAIAGMVGGVTSLLVIGWIVRTWLIGRRLRRQAELAARLQDSLIAKFQTSSELAEFLNSEAGRQILTTAPPTESAPGQPHARILAALQVGAVLAPVAIGLLLMQDLIEGAREGFVFLGVTGLCLAIGFLLSAAVAFWAARTWGLIDGATDDEP